MAAEVEILSSNVRTRNVSSPNFQTVCVACIQAYTSIQVTCVMFVLYGKILIKKTRFVFVLCLFCLVPYSALMYIVKAVNGTIMIMIDKILNISKNLFASFEIK